ncbi:MAG: L-lactate dehydrogenase [Candidatus Dojkabacteria bacterium]
MHTQELIPTGRAVIVGAGNVGASAAYALLNQDFIREIAIIDIAEDLVKAQVMDLAHGAALHSGVNIRVGDYDMLRDGDLVVITAGAAQKEGQTRMDLAQINVKITKSILGEIKQRKKDVYVMLISNPVDVLTYVAIKELDYLQPGRVFGSGTTLDSGRLAYVLSQKLDINPTEIEAYILGEHGDSSFPALSRATVHGQPLSEFIELTDEFTSQVQEEVRDAAYQIINGKGATNFGIGNSISFFARAIFENSKRVSPASVLLDGQYGLEDVVLGMPAFIDMKGVLPFKEMLLSEAEREKLEHSAQVIKDNIAKLEI